MNPVASAWRYLIETEPVILSAVLAALVYLAVEFGVPITEGQKDAIQAVAAALLLFFARARSTNDRTLIAAGTSRPEAALAARPDNNVQLQAVSNGRLLQDWERPRD